MYEFWSICEHALGSDLRVVLCHHLPSLRDHKTVRNLLSVSPSDVARRHSLVTFGYHQNDVWRGVF
jgi:hypothetical protein